MERKKDVFQCPKCKGKVTVGWLGEAIYFENFQDAPEKIIIKKEI